MVGNCPTCMVSYTGITTTLISTASQVGPLAPGGTDVETLIVEANVSLVPEPASVLLLLGGAFLGLRIVRGRLGLCLSEPSSRSSGLAASGSPVLECEEGAAFFEGVGGVVEEDEAEDDVFVFGGVRVGAAFVGGMPEVGFEADGGGCGGVVVGGFAGFGGG